MQKSAPISPDSAHGEKDDSKESFDLTKESPRLVRSVSSPRLGSEGAFELLKSFEVRQANVYWAKPSIRKHRLIPGWKETFSWQSVVFFFLFSLFHALKVLLVLKPPSLFWFLPTQSEPNVFRLNLPNTLLEANERDLTLMLSCPVQQSAAFSFRFREGNVKKRALRPSYLHLSQNHDDQSSLEQEFFAWWSLLTSLISQRKQSSFTFF
jgi:hypothetical protein